MGATGTTGSQGPAGPGFGTITSQQPGIDASIPARVLGTAFQISTVAPAMVAYRATASVTASLTGTNQGRVRLRMGPTSTSTVEQPGAVGITYSLGLGIAVANTVGNEGALHALVPPGWWVMLDTVVVSGSPALALISNATIAGAQVEQILG